MSKAARRAGLYLLGAFGVMLIYAVLYKLAMAHFEGIDVTYLKALHIVVETFTTTGFGEDAGQWTTSGMWILMIVMQLTGVGLIFMTLPLFIVPLVEEALTTTPPTSFDGGNHVIICSFTPRGDTLVDELDSMSVPYVIVEPDRDQAQDLHTRGYSVVHGDPELVDTIQTVNASDALALVADADDETNASIILSAKEAAPDLRVLSLVEDSTIADYHRYAGADRIVSPRRLLGESLANKTTTTVTTDLGDTIEVGSDLEIAELLVQHDSPLVGETVAESVIGDTGANVIGAWFGGEFVSPPNPETKIDEHTVLLVAGREAQLERLKELTLSTTRRHRRGHVLIAGYGEVGEAARDTLAATETPHVVIDIEDAPGVDVVGDATDRQTLEAAEIENSRTVILALDEDTTAIFATLAIQQIAPEVEIVVRANETDSIGKLYRAGADYVLALSTVSGRMLASHLLDEEVISPETQIEVVRTEAPALAGRTLAETDIRAQTNCTVIAVERDDTLVTDIGPDFRIQQDDVLVVVGVDKDINQFKEFAISGGIPPE